MTTGGEIDLAIVLAAFLTYAATLFWAMATSSVPSTVDTRRPPEN